MTVSSYQIQNVLRIYNKQLRLEKTDKIVSTDSPNSIEDEVNISLEARRKHIYEQIAAQVKERVIGNTDGMNSKF